MFKKLDLEHEGIGAKAIDLIVMDVRMPEIDGIEVCRCIKAVEALRDIPIIMMTARSQPEVLQAAFDAGAIGLHQETVRGGRTARADQRGIEAEARI